MSSDFCEPLSKSQTRPMLTAHELIGFMSAALATDILEHMYASDKELYKATISAVAQTRKVRPVFLEKQPRKERHAVMLATLAKPSMELAAATLIRGWLLKKQMRLLADFLEAIGIPHKDGVVDDLPETMDDTKLRDAELRVVQRLRQVIHHS